MSGKRRYTTGPIGSVMLKSALSMLPGTLAISGYNIVDTYFVSMLGKIPLAAMGYTFPIVMLIGCLYRGIDNGILTPVAQNLGGNRDFRASRLISSGIIFMILLALTVGTIGSGTIEPLFRNLLCANDEVMPDIRSYMTLWYLGSVTSALGMAGNSLLVASGESRIAGLVMLGGLFLNALIDPLFIFGFAFFPAMGVAGAAVATVIAQAICMGVTLTILHKKLHLIGSFRLPRNILLQHWRTIIRYGVPSACAMLLIPVGSTVVTRAVGEVGGNTAVAAAAAAGRIEILAFVFPMSLGITLLPMIGQNYGAGAWERINSCRRFAMRFAGGMLLFMSLLYTVFAEKMAGFFSRDPEIIAIMVDYLRIISWGFAGIEIHRFGGFFLTGCARPTAGAMLNGGRVVVLLIPLTLLAVHFQSLNGIFYARLATDLLSGVAGLIAARIVTRRQMGQTKISR